MSQENQKYNWIKVGVICKWNDPSIYEYDEEEQEYSKNRLWSIDEICYGDEDELVINDDTMIAITNEDDGYAEVNASELVELTKAMFEKVRELSNELDDTFRAIYNHVSFNKLNGYKTYYDGEELTTEMINQLWTKVIEVKDFCYC